MWSNRGMLYWEGARGWWAWGKDGNSIIHTTERNKSELVRDVQFSADVIRSHWHKWPPLRRKNGVKFVGGNGELLCLEHIGYVCSFNSAQV